MVARIKKRNEQDLKVLSHAILQIFITSFHADFYHMLSYRFLSCAFIQIFIMCYHTDFYHMLSLSLSHAFTEYHMVYMFITLFYNLSFNFMDVYLMISFRILSPYSTEFISRRIYDLISSDPLWQGTWKSQILRNQTFTRVS